MNALGGFLVEQWVTLAPGRGRVASRARGGSHHRLSLLDHQYKDWVEQSDLIVKGE